MNLYHVEIVAYTREVALRCTECLTGLATWQYGEPTIPDILSALLYMEHHCDDPANLERPVRVMDAPRVSLAKNGG
jgi:hypothetical protein